MPVMLQPNKSYTSYTSTLNNIKICMISTGNPCLENACLHGGHCTFAPHVPYGFRCKCRHNYIGFDCSKGKL